MRLLGGARLPPEILASARNLALPIETLRQPRTRPAPYAREQLSLRPRGSDSEIRHRTRARRTSDNRRQQIIRQGTTNDHETEESDDPRAAPARSSECRDDHDETERGSRQSKNQRDPITLC